MELAGERVLLRDLCENDREFFAMLEGHELTSTFESNRPDAVQIEDDFNNALLHPANVPREQFKLMVFCAEDQTRLGIISITGRTSGNGSSAGRCARSTGDKNMHPKQSGS